ncbi:hypothetical protein KSP39_PZI006381 [Platanthera zijinensis]|uniref:Uncharacterized protein n=1 Tax=Platanthera zijinensis TaxID=2320716 RepID=A0AAP0BPW0_9ASPA
MGRPLPENLPEKNITEEREACNYAVKLVSSTVLPMALSAAIQLGIFDVIGAPSIGTKLTSDELAVRLGATANPRSSAFMIERVLRLLASHSILRCSADILADGSRVHRYSAAPVCKYLTANEDGVSMAALSLMITDRVSMESWYYLKEAVLNGGVPAFNLAHGGMTEFEYHGSDPRFSRVFNDGMRSHSVIVMKNLLDVYRGFDGVDVLVDVGGGTGGTIGMITARHPHIRGINFDLPHVIAQAPPLPGVDHVGGDVFASIPSGDAIFMKWILHDWSDEDSMKILKNCWKALPENGKVIVVDFILPETPEAGDAAQCVYHADVIMMLESPGGKERTEKEFEKLAFLSGFSSFKVFCNFSGAFVMEFRK